MMTAKEQAGRDIANSSWETTGARVILKVNTRYLNKRKHGHKGITPLPANLFSIELGGQH